MTGIMTELDWARKIVQEVSVPAVVLELGAHHGNDTVEIFDACPRPCSYVAVEADPRNVPILVNRVGPRNIRVAHYAITWHCGQTELHLSSGPGATGSSSVREPKEHLRCFPTTTFQESVFVPAITLDALSYEYALSNIDLIWCDIQGAEIDMIRGGRATLAQTLYLLCECDREEMYEGQITRDDLLTALPGWEIVDEWPANANVLLRNKALL